MGLCPQTLQFFQVANLEDILAERDACGVGYIASLRNEASHKIVKDALTSLGCMEHRGGCGADNDSGDGAGVMTSIPWGLIKKWFKEQGLPEFDETHSGVGQVFLPRDETAAAAAKAGMFRKHALFIKNYMKESRLTSKLMMILRLKVRSAIESQLINLKRVLMWNN
jgi:glutamate synthase domain-containing protein 1